MSEFHYLGRGRLKTLSKAIHWIRQGVTAHGAVKGAIIICANVYKDPYATPADISVIELFMQTAERLALKRGLTLGGAV